MPAISKGLPSSIHLPPPLVPGDLLCVISPSGGLQTNEKFEEGLAIWRQRGYKLHLCDGYDQCWRYLAGTDAQRRHQLSEALHHPESKGILCARGGYGGTRLLESWQWPKKQATQWPSNKWLIGFSDITSLLWSLSKEGIAGVHGPVLTTLADEPQWSIERLFDLVEKRQVKPLQGKGWAQTKGPAQATGRLLPGNLCVATCLLGTAAEPDLTDVILAFEDVGEALYRLDRMLTQWRAMGKLKQVRGIALGRFSRWEPLKPSPTLTQRAMGKLNQVRGMALGRFSRWEPPKPSLPPPPGPTLTVEEVMRDRLSDLGIPIVSDLPFGHDGVNAALPVGLPVHLDAQTGQLSWA
ncbi:MAG: LD-carboxypeptidase [Cyanobacteria bacterium J06643_4]